MQLSTAAPLNRFHTLKTTKMANPFDGKFTAFTANLTAKNSEQHAQNVGAKSAEIFKDKPFSEEYKTVYLVTQVGQSLSQIVTYTTTAALGVFALTHIIPLWWGVYVAIPIALLFAFGVEKIKRSTLAIASKHLLKYKTVGFVGVAAGLVMCVSIAAALYGAKELPGVVFPPSARETNTAQVEALESDLKRVQDDIDRTAASIRVAPNWTAENRTLPQLQRQRAALIEKRTAATATAEARADADRAAGEVERVAKVEKMQWYSVGAAIVAEAVFLLCTMFIFYYLFRHYAEVNPNAEGEEIEGEDVASGIPQREGIRYTTTANLTASGTRATKIVNDVGEGVPSGKNRICDFCKTSYIYAHSKQKYCCEKCRIAAWENRTGATLRHKK